MKYLSLTVAAAALILTPTTANAQFFGGFDNSSVLGGLAGAGIGGAIGSNLAGSGNRNEGTAIGAALGGLAGTAYGNRNSRYGGNPYAGSFNPGFSGNSLFGTAVGAGIGGAIGSNLAGSGVRQEGTAIGAVLGGLAGNAISSRSRYGNSGYGGGYAPAGFNGGFGGGNTRYGGNAPMIGGGFGAPAFGTPNFGAPAFGGGFVPPSYGPTFPPMMAAPQFGATLPPFPTGGTSFAPGGFVNAGTFANTTTIPAPMPTFIPAPAPVYQPLSNAFTGVTVAAPNVTLAGPLLRSTTVRSHSTRYGDSIGSTTTQNYSGSTGINAPLILRGSSAPKSRLVVIQRDHYTPRVSSVSTHSHGATYAPSHTSGHSHNSAMSHSAAPAGIHADTVNINYGNNSQVGTTNSNNGSTVGAGHGHGHATRGYTAPSAPVYDMGDGIGDGTWGHGGSSVNTGSYSIGSTSVLGGYSSGSTRYSDGGGEAYAAPVMPAANAGAGGSYFVGSGQSFQAPSSAEVAADCATSTFGCAGSTTPSYNWNTQASSTSHGGYTSGHTSHSSTNRSKAGQYSYCDSDKVYNDDGALMLGGSPYCR